MESSVLTKVAPSRDQAEVTIDLRSADQSRVGPRNSSNAKRQPCHRAIDRCLQRSLPETRPPSRKDGGHSSLWCFEIPEGP